MLQIMPEPHLQDMHSTSTTISGTSSKTLWNLVPYRQRLVQLFQGHQLSSFWQRNIWRFWPGFIPPPRASGENRCLAHEEQRLHLHNRRSKCTCHRTANIAQVSSIQDSIYAYRLPYPLSISGILTRYSLSWIRGSIQSKCPLFSHRCHQRMHDICTQYGKPQSKASTVNGYRLQPIRCNTPVSFQWVGNYPF